MKRTLLLALLLAGPSAPASLEVHEWGTFTTLSDSSGRARSWYLPYRDPTALPAFVGGAGLALLKTAPARMRMETPVIYFYPDQAGPIEVEALLRQGRITEVYPLSEGPTGLDGVAVRWIGKLVPPDDGASLALVPAVAPGEPGAHYAAARAVPDAWTFRRAVRLRDTPGTARPDQAERFIFYRGSGEALPPLSARALPGQGISITNNGPHPVAHALALEVREDKARWMSLPSLPGRQEKQSPATHTASLPQPWHPVEVVEAELVRWFRVALTSDGLSADEATAMLATWQGTWFREPGLRVFSLTPRAWVDEILPLSIQPLPDKLVRVFVARHELLAPEREQALAALLSDQTLGSREAREQLGDLELGRLADAFIERAAEVQLQAMLHRYRELLGPPGQAAR